MTKSCNDYDLMNMDRSCQFIVVFRLIPFVPNPCAKHLRLAYDHFRAGRHSDALEELTTASEIDPNVPVPSETVEEVMQRVLKGTVLISASDFAKAQHVRLA